MVEKGDRVIVQWHGDRGEGRVVSVEGHYVEVVFPDGKTVTLDAYKTSLSVVLPATQLGGTTQRGGGSAATERSGVVDRRPVAGTPCQEARTVAPPWLQETGVRRSGRDPEGARQVAAAADTPGSTTLDRGSKRPEERQPQPSSSTPRPTSRQRSNWQQVRRAILERDGRRCLNCHVPHDERHLDVHHMLPRALGGADDPSNLITLCDGCHASVHTHLQGGLARGLIERWAIKLARFSPGRREYPRALRAWALRCASWALPAFAKAKWTLSFRHSGASPSCWLAQPVPARACASRSLR